MEVSRYEPNAGTTICFLLSYKLEVTSTVALSFFFGMLNVAVFDRPNYHLQSFLFI
jgi:hypothetical protein